VLNLLRGDLLWTGFVVVVVAVAVLPAAVTRNRSVIVSWEALALATLPLVARFGDRFVEPLTYVPVATLALLSRWRSSCSPRRRCRPGSPSRSS